jgi:hypothetical protein
MDIAIMATGDGAYAKKTKNFREVCFGSMNSKLFESLLKLKLNRC